MPERKNTTTISRLSETIGRDVLTADGRRLGTVKEISGSYLQVNAPRRADYWLSGEQVERISDDAVTLRFPYRELGEFRLPEPGLEPSEDPLRHIAGKPVLTEEEQLEQRRRMAMELASQRRRLPHWHARGMGSPPETPGSVGEPVESELARTAAQQPHIEASPGEKTAASPTGAVIRTDPEAENARRAGMYWPEAPDGRPRPEDARTNTGASSGSPAMPPVILLAMAGVLVATSILAKLLRQILRQGGRR